MSVGLCIMSMYIKGMNFKKTFLEKLRVKPVISFKNVFLEVCMFSHSKIEQ